IDSLFDEFAGELTLLTSISPGIGETDCHHEKEIRLAKRLLYDNSSPRLPEEIIFDNSNADIESFSPSPIPNKDSDSHMEEIDLPFTPDDPMPPGIEEDDDYDSGRDIPILEELLDNYFLSLPGKIDLPFTPDDPMTPGIEEDDDYDSGRDIPILEELLDNYFLSLPGSESYDFDIPSPDRPPAKPPD
nr:hypothetical protein [Tanacetum cinerariifolium]